METIGGYEVHPAAECFPLMQGDEFKELKTSIEILGLQHPIVLNEDDLIVDGRNRAKACEELGVEIEFEFFEDLSNTQDGDVLSYVIASNLTRRHMDLGERAVAADKLARLPVGRQAETNGPVGLGTTQPDAASLLKVGTRTVKRVAAIRKAGRMDLYDKVGAGEMSPARAEKTMRRDATVKKINKEPQPLPEGPFRVIIADPAWRYDKRLEDETSRGKAEDQYPTMSIEQITDLPVEDLAHDEGTVLWLWTTNAHILECGPILDAWGFTPKTILTWDKGSIGTGDWLRGQTEHCIVAVRGKATVTLTNQSTILKASRREHSRKPEEFYELVNSLCPGSKVELFAREAREGITAWGAESDLFTSQ